MQIPGGGRTLDLNGLTEDMNDQTVESDFQVKGESLYSPPPPKKKKKKKKMFYSS